MDRVHNEWETASVDSLAIGVWLMWCERVGWHRIECHRGVEICISHCIAVWLCASSPASPENKSLARKQPHALHVYNPIKVSAHTDCRSNFILRITPLMQLPPTRGGTISQSRTSLGIIQTDYAACMCWYFVLPHTHTHTHTWCDATDKIDVASNLFIPQCRRQRIMHPTGDINSWDYFGHENYCI